MDALDRDIGPHTLKDEIVYVLRHAAGPMLRIPLMERCKLAGTFDNFSVEFGELVATGTVRAVSGHGPRMLFTLSEAAQETHKVTRDMSRSGRAETVSWNRTEGAKRKRDQVEKNRQLILQFLSAGTWMYPVEVRKGTGLSLGVCNYLLTQLMHERKLERQGKYTSSEYRLTEAGRTAIRSSAPEAPKGAEITPVADDLVVRVKLAAHEVQPFFKFLKELRPGSGLSA